MRSTLQETRREFRWIISSRAGVALVGAALISSAWAAVAGVSSTLALVNQFRATLQLLKENGEDVTKALATPSVVTGDPSQQAISNPLRYDLDQAVQALTQVSGTGAVASAMSLAAFLFFPLIGFALGIFMATHDVKSGSIAFRWAQSGWKSVTVSKPLAAVTAMAVLGVLTAVFSTVGALITAPIVAGMSEDLASFAQPGPSVSQTVATGLIAVLVGIVSAAAGLLVGTLTRNRTFTLTAFALAYFLLPMLGAWDPRNMIPLAGTDVLYFVGQFRPAAVGDLVPAVGFVALASLFMVCTVLAIPLWRMRARLPTTM